MKFEEFTFVCILIFVAMLVVFGIALGLAEEKKEPTVYATKEVKEFCKRHLQDVTHLKAFTANQVYYLEQKIEKLRREVKALKEEMRKVKK